MRPALEVADIFRRHGEAFRRSHDGHLGRVERRVMAAIEACRTPVLGGHVEQCGDCGLVRCAYNSCRNRHCPKCQGLARAEWLEARQAELLPVPYFHVVFTLPAPAAEIAFQNKRVVYAILFRAAAEALREHRRRPQASRRRDRRHRGAAHLGADPAASSASALHRSGRRPVARRRAVGGVPARLLPAGAGAVPALPRPVPGAAAGGIHAPAHSASPARLPPWPNRTPSPGASRPCAASTGWSMPSAPFAGPAQVLAYLGRYTHRVAIANSRLTRLADGHVDFAGRTTGTTARPK